MKTLFSIIIILLVTTAVRAQIVITKTIEYTGRKIEMEFGFANSIRIETWDKSIVELEVTVSIENNRLNDHYNLDISKRGNSLKLIEKIDLGTINKMNNSIIYKLKVPANRKISLNTLVGEIELVGLLGKSDISSTIGFIDYSIPKKQKAKLSVSTISGSIFQNIDFESYEIDDSPEGTKINMTLNGGRTDISLNTTDGDIYLREMTR